MQLNLTTDYAIRFLLCLGDTKGIMTGSLIADQMKIPPKYLLKIARKLRGAGMLGTVTGAKGGYYLLRSLEEITLLDVLNVMESSVKVNRCLEDDGYCNRGAVSTCQIRKYYQYIQKEMENKWFSKSLGEIIKMMDAETCAADDMQKELTEIKCSHGLREQRLARRRELQANIIESIPVAQCVSEENGKGYHEKIV